MCCRSRLIEMLVVVLFHGIGYCSKHKPTKTCCWVNTPTGLAVLQAVVGI
jgi:hypothetical protein